jgi:hypothetical protein
MVSLAAKNQLPGMYSDRLYTGTTSGTDATGIHHTPDRGKVTFFEFRYGPAGFHHPADDLVPGNTGINRRHRVLPFVSDLVQIRMQTPQYKISICRSCGRGSRRRIVKGAMPEVGLRAA